MREKIKDIIAWAILICVLVALALFFLAMFYCFGEKEFGNGLLGVLFPCGCLGIAFAVIWAANRVT